MASKLQQNLTLSSGGLSPEQNRLRRHYRNAYLVATAQEAQCGIDQAKDQGDWFKAVCIMEIYYSEAVIPSPNDLEG